MALKDKLDPEGKFKSWGDYLKFLARPALVVGTAFALWYGGKAVFTSLGGGDIYDHFTQGGHVNLKTLKKQTVAIDEIVTNTLYELAEQRGWKTHPLPENVIRVGYMTAFDTPFPDDSGEYRITLRPLQTAQQLKVRIKKNFDRFWETYGVGDIPLERRRNRAPTTPRTAPSRTEPRVIIPRRDSYTFTGAPTRGTPIAENPPVEQQYDRIEIWDGSVYFTKQGDMKSIKDVMEFFTRDMGRKKGIPTSKLAYAQAAVYRAAAATDFPIYKGGFQFPDEINAERIEKRFDKFWPMYNPDKKK